MGKSKIKPFIIVGVIVLLIGLIIGIYFYINTDFLKSPKTLFIKYFSQVTSMLEPKGMDVSKNLEKYMELKNYKEVGSTTLNFSGTNDFENVAEYVLKSEFEKDVSNNKINMPISLNYKNHELLSGTVLSANDLYGININGLTDKYVAIKNNNLKDLANKLGIENSNFIPNSITKINYKELKVEELDNIFKKYVENIDLAFNKDAFSKESDFKITIESEEFVTNRYIFTTNVNEFYTFLKNQLNIMKKDDSLKSLLSQKFNISNDIIETYLDELIKRCEKNINENEGSNEFNVYVYECNGKLLKIEASTDNIAYEIYVYEKDDNVKLFVNYNNIELITRKTVETLKFIVQNTYNDNSMNMSFVVTSKTKNNNKVEGNMAEYNEADYRIQYGINNVSENGADRSFVAVINNKKVLEYKSKITIGVNVEIDTISSENADVLNDMSDESLRNLVGTLTENTAGFIDVSNIVEPEEDTNNLIDTSTMDSAINDLNLAFLNIEAAYNLEQRGDISLLDYFTQEKLKNEANFGNEILLSNEKDIILYRNKARQTFQFNIIVSDTKIEIVDSYELKDAYEFTLNDILYPPQPEPEPEPEPEENLVPNIDPVEDDLPNNDIVSLMKSEIDSYLLAVYNEAMTTEEELVAADYINSDQLVLNCSTIYEAYVEEKEGGMFVVECKDEEGNLYSGVIQITEDGLNLLMFN